MIRSWSLRNFKSIHDQSDLELGDLTIFAGANSSGKSTIIQSILLIMQTLVNRQNIALQLNGDLVSLGQTDDIWYNGDLPQYDKKGNLARGHENKRMIFQMALRETQSGNGIVYYHLEFEPQGSTYVRLAHAQYAIDPMGSDDYSLSLGIAWDRTHYEIIEEETALSIEEELKEQGLNDITSLNEVTVEDFFPSAIHIEAKTRTKEIDWPLVLIDVLEHSFTKEMLQLAIPNEHLVILQEGIRDLNLDSSRSLLRQSLKLNTLDDYYRWFSKLSSLHSRQFREYLVQHLPGVVVNVQQWRTLGFFDILKQTATQVFTERIRYLSANRLAPTMLFANNVMGSNWSEVGITGQNVAAALQEYGQRIIRLWDPQNHKVRETTLLEGLIQWLRFFQLVDRVEAEDRGKLGTLLKVYATGVNKELDLTAVGFGTSQILPILVQGLLTPPHSIFIVEQPEVHLHPRVQSQLAFFFFALTKVGVQCIIETHSEYIVNQLRLLIKQQQQLRHSIKIYFAERDSQTGTHFQEVMLDEDGTILNWPDGFMDEGSKLAQEIILSLAQPTGE